MRFSRYNDKFHSIQYYSIIRKLSKWTWYIVNVCTMKPVYCSNPAIQITTYAVMCRKRTFPLFHFLPWQHQSWTDDLPLCQMCGVGTAPNCVYGPDGKGTQSHTNEDGHLRFRWDTLEMQKLSVGTENQVKTETNRHEKNIVMPIEKHQFGVLDEGYFVFQISLCIPSLKWNKSHMFVCFFSTNQRRGWLFPVWGV